MTIVPAQIHHALQADEATRMTALWPDLLSSQIQSQTQADQIRVNIHSLTIPATRQWIAGRVATLLSQYFASSIPSEVMTAIAADWHEELQSYPGWALQKACRWWMSADNSERRKKPMPGDIAIRAKREMGVVKIADRAVRQFGGPVSKPSVRQPPATPEAADAIVDAAGFKLKRFGGGS